MKLIDLTNFKAVLFVEQSDIINKYVGFFNSFEAILNKGYTVHRINKINHVSEDFCKEVVEKYNDDLYMNYQNSFFESDQFREAKLSFQSFLNKQKISKTEQFVIILKKHYYRLNFPNGDILTFVLISKHTKQIKKYRSLNGKWCLITNLNKIYLPFDFEIIHKSNYLTEEECRIYMKKPVNSTGNKELFTIYIKEKIKYDEEQLLLVLKDKEQPRNKKKRSEN